MAKRRHGPFCKAFVLGHHALFFPEHQAGSGRCLFGVVFKELLPLILIHYHMAEAQLFNIVARIADRDLAGMMEPVTISDAPRADAFHFVVNDIIAKERDYDLARANPTEALGVLPCSSSTHGFVDRHSISFGKKFPIRDY